jgi:hypothetical protein
VLALAQFHHFAHLPLPAGPRTAGVKGKAIMSQEVRAPGLLQPHIPGPYDKGNALPDVMSKASCLCYVPLPPRLPFCQSAVLHVCLSLSARAHLTQPQLLAAVYGFCPLTTAQGAQGDPGERCGWRSLQISDVLIFTDCEDGEGDASWHLLLQQSCSPALTPSCLFI